MLSWDEFNQDEALDKKPGPKIEQKAEESQIDQQVPLQEKLLLVNDLHK